MKKTLLVLALALVFTMGFSAIALATNPLDPADPNGYGVPSGDSITTQPAYPTGQTNPYIAIDPATGVAKNIHSGYQKNTDACSSCHSTHTAQGAALLQWESVSATCDACHDGTVTTTYDVNNGFIDGANTKITYAGLFDYAGTTQSNSMHNVTRLGVATPILGAPGGSLTGTADTKGAWSGEFDCISCHDPHGRNANYRILSPDPNGIGTANKKTAVTLTNPSGDLLTYVSADSSWVAGYPYTPAIYKNGVQDRTVTINYLSGSVTFAAPLLATDVVTATYTPALKVVGTVTNKLTTNETVTYTSGMNAFCGACHTDYDTSDVENGMPTPTGAAENLNGYYTKAYRHQVGYTWHGAVPGLVFEPSYTVTCLTCHTAHGVNQAWWQAWATQSGWTGDATQGEEAGTSALKRLPNMSTCEACHGKGKGNLQY